jgi:hypothetical protein
MRLGLFLQVSGYRAVHSEAEARTGSGQCVSEMYSVRGMYERVGRKNGGKRADFP